jgi:hypothetical protein
MKIRIQSIILSMIAAVGLSSCFDVHQVVNVKKDGSGTVEETMLVSIPPELAALGGDQDPIADLLKQGKHKERAKQMGEGVEFVSAEPFAGKDGAKGLKTIFKFTDISKLKLSGDGGMSGMNPDPNAAAVVKKDEQLIRFKFDKAATKLTVISPPMEGIDGMDGPEVDPAQFAMASQIMKGMRLRVTLKPEGKITKTNASYSDAESVTLMDLEMKKLVTDLDTFKAFSALAKEKDRTKVAAKLKEFGIKAETKEEIDVEFK